MTLHAILAQTVTIEQLIATAKQWLAANGLNFLRNAVVALVIFMVGRLLANGARRLVLKLLANRHVDETASRFMANLGSAGIMLLVAITALGQLGVPTAQFAALIAAAGLAIGLALQGNLSNFAAGFLIIFFRPFKKGDYIAGGGTEGTVEEVQMFTTVITTLDNKKIIVPNAKFTGDNIVNFTANALRRVDLTFVVGLQNDITRVRQALFEVAKTEPRALPDPPPEAVLRDINGRLAYDLRVWCKTTDFPAVHESLCEKVSRRFAADEIGGPVPLQLFKFAEPPTVHWSPTQAPGQTGH